MWFLSCQGVFCTRMGFCELVSPKLRVACASKHSDGERIPNRVWAKLFRYAVMGLPASSCSWSTALDPLEMSRTPVAESNIYHIHQFSVKLKCWHDTDKVTCQICTGWEKSPFVSDTEQGQGKAGFNSGWATVCARQRGRSHLTVPQVPFYETGIKMHPGLLGGGEDN